MEIDERKRDILERKAERQKYRKTKRQKDRKTERQKERERKRDEGRQGRRKERKKENVNATISSSSVTARMGICYLIMVASSNYQAFSPPQFIVSSPHSPQSSVSSK